MTADLPGGFDDLGDAAVGRPEHPAVQFGPGLVAGRLGIVRRGCCLLPNCFVFLSNPML